MTLKQQWRDGGGYAGIWSGLDDPVTIELIGRSGFDFVAIDLQHSFATMHSVGALLNALHTTPSGSVVRVPWNSPEHIMRVLDLGAEGVIVPLVNTVEEAKQAADACRYSPVGNRSWGPIWHDARRHLPEVPEGDATAICIVMIETQGGLDNLADIIAVEGVDAVYVGPNDLSMSTGLGRTSPEKSPELLAMIDRIIEVTHAAGKIAGMDCAGGGAEAAHFWRERGMDFALCAKDSSLLLQASEDVVRGIAEGASGSSEGGHP